MLARRRQAHITIFPNKLLAVSLSIGCFYINKKTAQGALNFLSHTQVWKVWIINKIKFETNLVCHLVSGHVGFETISPRSIIWFVQGLPVRSLQQLNTRYQLPLWTMIDTLPLEALLSNISHQSTAAIFPRAREAKGEKWKLDWINCLMRCVEDWGSGPPASAVS